MSPHIGAAAPDASGSSSASLSHSHAEKTQAVRRGLVFSTVSLGLLMAAIDSTIVATALHALEHGLGTSINWAGWTITGYSVGFVLMLPLCSRLSDRYGRRRVFLGSVALFTVTSLCCGLANDIYLLIVFRCLQAAGGAGFTPSATGIVVDHFGEARDRAVGLFGSIFSIGGMIGPIFGGLIVAYWNWRGVFFVNVPIGVLLFALCLRFVPRDPPIAKERRLALDYLGIAFLGVGLLGIMLSVGYLGEPAARASSALFIGPLAAGIVAIVLFVRHIRKSDAPLIPTQLIYGARFGPVNLINLIYGGVSFGVITLIPIYAINRYGIDSLRSGTLLTAEGAAAIVLSILGALALRRTGFRRPLYVGGVIIAVGTFLLAIHLRGVSPYVWLAGAALLIGVGSGVVNPAGRNAGLHLAPEHSATLSALRSMCILIGEITTVSIATAVIAKGHDAGTVQASLYVVIAAVLGAALLVVPRVPEHRGPW